MKRNWKKFCLAVGIGFIYLIIGSGSCLAQEQQTQILQTQVQSQEKTWEHIIAPETSQVILVTETEGAEVTVAYYRKEENRKGPGETETVWNQSFEVSGLCGHGGITKEKREGDGKTPAGVFGISMAFGILEDPGSVLPYHQLQDRDYWVDDPDSIYYNQLVNIQETGQAWTSAEHMAAVSPEYNYGLALDYNKECVPGAGSAIFIHCEKPEKDNGSQGCIRIPEEQMKLLIQSVDETCQVVIGKEFTGV